MQQSCETIINHCSRWNRCFYRWLNATTTLKWMHLRALNHLLFFFCCCCHYLDWRKWHLASVLPDIVNPHSASSRNIRTQWKVLLLSKEILLSIADIHFSFIMTRENCANLFIVWNILLEIVYNNLHIFLGKYFICVNLNFRYNYTIVEWNHSRYDFNNKFKTSNFVMIVKYIQIFVCKPLIG